MRSELPLDEDQMRRAAPSIFATGKHASRSERYTFIPTNDVLRGLRKEGFEPFVVAHGKHDGLRVGTWGPPKLRLASVM